jgi:predicted transcriptional regulator
MTSKPEKEAKPDLYVVARFLEKLITTGGSRRKTELQMAVGLNFNVYSKYLEWLETKGLIRTAEEDERSKYVSLTPKGMDTYKTLVKWIKDVVGSP